MHRSSKVAALCALAVTASACSQDEVIQTENIPTAGVRFINAVPDSSGGKGMDLRFVDIVENNAHFNVPFRGNIVTTGGVPASTLIEFRGARAGQRRFRIFLSDSIQSIASTVVKDTTVTLEAGKLYTALLWGNARTAPALRLTFREETPPDPGAGNVALRVINATGSAIDVRSYLSTATLPATANFANVGPLTTTSWITVPASTLGTTTYRFNVQPAGGGTALFADATALPGQAATVDIEATPGTSVAGSAVTAIIFPRSTVGARTPQTAAFQVPAISFVWDRRPPRTCSPLC